jgi:hypothetical protein
MKKKLIIFSMSVLTVIIFSCNNSNSKANNNKSTVSNTDNLIAKESKTDTLDNIVRSIIDISANDFYKNQQPEPVAFKNVKLKYIKKTNGEELYILCGQFVTNDKQEIQFATVKNSDYEQWVGTSAITYCQDSKEMSYTKIDLSSALKKKFDSLKK